MDHDMALYGGNVNRVVRTGDAIHRSKQWDPKIHDLLKFLEKQGFYHAPRFLGIDEQGREVLSFIPGDVPGNDYPNCKPYVWSDRTLYLAAKMLRKYHDVTRLFVPFAQESGWKNPYVGENQYEVICHNDAAPYNFVFRDEVPVALIDFDTASPGPRIWDIAYALYTFVPLAGFEPELKTCSTVAYNPCQHAFNRQRRVGLFFDAYGIIPPNDLKEWVIKRLQALCDTLETGASRGNKAYQKMIDEGHLAHYKAEIAFLRDHFGDWCRRD